MAETSGELDPIDFVTSKDDFIVEDIKFQYQWYLFAFFLIYLGSFLLPAIIFMLYVLLFFVPYFLESTNFFLIFIELKSLVTLIFMPLVIIGCYLVHLFFVAFITRFFWRYTERKSPSKPGIIPRNFPSKTLDFYHIRSFLIKYPKNAFVKGPFPWLINWFFNYVGTNVIGKGSTIEEQVVGGKFCEIGKNCYVGVNSALSTHFVEGIFGNVVYFKIKLGDNVTLATFNNIAPGCEISDNSYILPMGACTKFNMLKGNNYYYGMPVRKIFKRKIMDYLKVSKEDLDKAEELRVKQEQSKKMQKNSL
ncbi:MAG: hypothetical protein ACTSRI_15060 [Promethearchaeota archaeon]